MCGRSTCGGVCIALVGAQRMSNIYIYTHTHDGYILSISSDVVEAAQMPLSRDRWSRASSSGAHRASHVASRPHGVGNRDAAGCDVGRAIGD
jgi:hypothetical protein